MELMFHIIMDDVETVTDELAQLMILINRCAQAPRPRAPIPMRYLFFMNKAFIEYLGTISLCHMIV